MAHDMSWDWAYFLVSLAVFSSSAVFAVLRMVRTGSSNDVSLLWTFLVFIGLVFSVCLIISKDSNWMVIVERVIGSVFALGVFLVTVYYRQRKT